MSKSTRAHCAPVPFSFNNNAIRAINKDGEIWFIASDVCEVLEIKNVSQAITSLDDDERSMFNIGRSTIHGGGGEVNIISESGLYTLTMRSRKKEAKAFRKWVTKEVLPQIRKTGAYAAQTADTVPAISHTTNPMVSLRYKRFMAYFDANEKLTFTEIPEGAFVIKPSDIAGIIKEPGGISNADLLDIMNACSEAIARRFGNISYAGRI